MTKPQPQPETARVTRMPVRHSLKPQSRAMIPADRRQTVYYHWLPSGSPVAVMLSLAVVEALRSQLNEGAAMRAGGLLLGHAVQEGGDWRVHVDDFEPVMWDMQRGGAPCLTEKQRDLFSRSVERWRPTPGRSTHVVGYYRAASGPFTLTDEDLQIFDTYFTHGSDIALMVKPAQGVALGAIFVRQRDGEIVRTAATGQEFPFDSGSSFVVAPSASPAETDRRSRNRFFIALLATLLIIIAATGAIAWNTWRSFNTSKNPPSSPASNVASSSSSPLDLQVQRTDADLMLSWDRTAPAILSAVSGEIMVNDASFSRTFTLTGDQVRAGRFFYRALTGDIGLRITVYTTDRGTVTEAIRTADGTAPLMAYTQPVPMAPYSTLPPLERGTPPRSMPQFNMPRSTPQEPRATAPVNSRSAAALEPEPEPSIPTPSRRTEPAPSAAKPSVPPPADSPLPQPVETAAVRTAPPPAPAPAQPTPTIGTRQEPGRPTAPVMNMPSPSSLAQAPPPTANFTRDEIVPATPVQREIPRMPDNLAHMLTSPLGVDVKVRIDESGRVASAEPVAKATGYNAYLAQLAVNAARRWRFNPATRNGTKTGSDLVLHFVFKPR